MARARKRPANSPSWSYNLHSKSACFVSDSDDTDEGESLDRSPHGVTEDARLIQELDLSARPDQAQYKPNPWAIAKANAATRGRRSKLQSPAVAIKPKPPLTGPIIDSLKRQSEKGPVNDPALRQVPTTRLDSPKPQKKGAISRKLNTMSKSKMSSAPTNLNKISGNLLTPLPTPDLEIDRMVARNGAYSHPFGESQATTHDPARLSQMNLGANLAVTSTARTDGAGSQPAAPYVSAAPSQNEILSGLNI